MKKIFVMLLLSCFAPALHVNAGDFLNGASVEISSPFYGDLYIAGGNIRINAPVHGDVIVMGGTVIINDSVYNDVIIAGGRVEVNGYVGDDIRCAGGELKFSGYVEGDLITAGGITRITGEGSAASIVAAGGELVVDGTSRSSIKAYAGKVSLNGIINNDADLRGGTILINGTIKGKVSLGASREIVIAPGARIGRSIRYWLPFERPLVIPEGVSNQKPVYDALLSITYSKWYFLGASTFVGLLWYVGMAYILMLLAYYLFPSLFIRAGQTMLATPLKSAMYGALFFVGVPIASVLLLITVIGFPLAVLTILTYITTLLMTTVISAVVITSWVERFSGANWKFWRKSGIALFTFILLKIIWYTPFLGNVIAVFVSAMVFGSIILSIRWKRTPPQLTGDWNRPAPISPSAATP